ncbi:uncharacterized protein [Aegilops tauschii subsp. strangulata]|uniref:uncharacterized protein n=1 Tax=Aegilops tauschii subsp. strangulata TaxID=200361 RepID=UPI003CC89CF1
MEAYLAEVCKIEKQFFGLELQHMPRDTNKEADEIAKRASRRLPHEPWSLRSGSSSLQQPHRLRNRKQGCELLADIHGGDCGHHSSPRTLVGKSFRSGFYWPTALNDATDLVRSYEACQFHTK